MAQGKRAGPITLRSMDRNHLEQISFLSTALTQFGQSVGLLSRKPWVRAPHVVWSCSIMVSTVDFESTNHGSIPCRTIRRVHKFP